MTETSTDLVIPTGEIVPLNDPGRVADAIETLRQLEYLIREAKAELTHVLVSHSRELGLKTLRLDDGHQVTIKSGSETIYDAEEIMEGLREAGMPEQRISEVVREMVTYKVNAVEAKRAASVNTDYKDVIERHSHIEERRPSIEIKRWKDDGREL